MTVGTTLSRLTGYVRIAAQTAALGVTVGSLGNVYVQANTTPNIVYELILGGILTSVFVPVFVEHRRSHGREAAFDLGRRVLTLALVVLLVRRGARDRLRARRSCGCTSSASDAADRQATDRSRCVLLRWFMPQVVFYGIGAIAGGLLEHRAPLRRADVRADPQQSGRDRHVRRLRDRYARVPTPSVDDITWLEKTVLGAGTTLGRGRDDGGAVAVAAQRRIPVAPRRRMGPSRHPARRAALGLGRSCTSSANQAAYLVIIVLAGGIDGAAVSRSTPRHSSSSCCPTRSSPSRSSPRCCLRWRSAGATGDIVGVRERFSLGLRDTVVVIVPAAFAFIVLAEPDHVAAAAARQPPTPSTHA